MHSSTLRTALTLVASLVCFASLVCSEEVTCSDASAEVAPALLQVGAQPHNFRESVKEEPEEKKEPEEKPEEKKEPQEKKEPEKKKEPEAKNAPEEKKEFFKAPEEKKEEESKKASMKDDSENATISEAHCGSAFMDADIDMEKARMCTPDGLVNYYLAQKEKMNLLRKGEDLYRKDAGASAPLTAAGFKTVTSMKCPPEMETFFTRILDDMGLDVCSKPHVQGLMHWFSGVPDMDYQYVIDVINNGNPCKFWAPKGATCPTLSPECEDASGCR